MVNRGKELTYVALQHPAGANMIFGDFASVGAKPVHRAVRTLACATRVGVGYETRVEVRIEYAVYGVMQQTVAHTSLVDIAWFRVRYAEVLVAAVAVSLTY